MAVGRLVVVSNRVPAISVPTSEQERRSQPVGGLVTALRSALEQRGGVWFGWSGQSTARKPSADATTTQIGNISLSTIDLSQNDANLFYGPFCQPHALAPVPQQPGPGDHPPRRLPLLSQGEPQVR